MATTEHTINDALAEVLRKTRSAWRTSHVVSSENTGMLKGSEKRPDILVIEASVSPVVIETEVLPAASVESETVSRLGQQVRTTGRKILSSVALRLPLRFRTKHGAALQEEISKANDIEMAMYTGGAPDLAKRWPSSGWLVGGIGDISILVQAASVPPEVIEQAADQLTSGVQEAAALVAEIAESHEAAIKKISEELHQEPGNQTQRMAATILANAFVFQESLANGPDELSKVKSIEQLRGGSGLSQANVLEEWRKILKVNYWPIFDIARRILEHIPASATKGIIERLAKTADRLVENNLMRSHDLTGKVFQRLIADRKFLAAYYTDPTSAALLVGLALKPDKPPGGGSFSDPEDLKKLRIADFACGTGTLLSTAYQRLGQLHELALGDAEILHPEMMAHVMIGCDVLPAATHLTASMLSGAHPRVKYKGGGVLTVAYGKQDGGDIALGSLNLLDPQGTFEIVAVTAKAVEAMGQSEKQTWSTLPHAFFDLVIMNPPFTRDTGHEGKKKGVRNPMFAAFGATREEQELMAEATRKLIKRMGSSNIHGNAGEASMFLALADQKLKPGGTLALVMPLSLMVGDAWERSRKLLADRYADLVLVSIAGAEDKDMSFSADTDMGECLVVGHQSTTGSSRAMFVVLKARPGSVLLGASTAEQIRRVCASQDLKRLEDGPMGGTPLHFGDEVVGYVLDAPLPSSGGWNLSRIADLSLAQASYQLSRGLIWLPMMNKSEAIPLKITTVEVIGKIGPYHADINGIAKGKKGKKSIRGPFDVVPLQGGVPTYPVIWTHEAARERTMSFEGDKEGLPRKGSTAKEQAQVALKIASVWASASHCHSNRDFRFNSQSTAMQFTPRRSIGGRAWLSIQLASPELEKALVLWANTSFGILMYWWHANKQQSGRGSVAKSSLHDLPVLDVTSLKPQQLKAAVKLFNEMSGLELLPVHQIAEDPVRRQLDERFAREVLSLPESMLLSGGPLDVLRMKLAQEPSIYGSKDSTADENDDDEEDEDEEE